MFFLLGIDHLKKGTRDESKLQGNRMAAEGRDFCRRISTKCIESSKQTLDENF